MPSRIVISANIKLCAIRKSIIDLIRQCRGNNTFTDLEKHPLSNNLRHTVDNGSLAVRALQ